MFIVYYKLEKMEIYKNNYEKYKWNLFQSSVTPQHASSSCSKAVKAFTLLLISYGPKNFSDSF